MSAAALGTPVGCSHGFSGAEVVQNDGDHDASTTNAGLAVADLRINRNAVFPIHGRLSVEMALTIRDGWAWVDLKTGPTHLQCGDVGSLGASPDLRSTI